MRHTIGPLALLALASAQLAPADTTVPVHRARTTRLTACGITRVMATGAPASAGGISLPAGTLLECVQGIPGRLPDMYLVRAWPEEPGGRQRIHRYRVPGGSWRHGLVGHVAADGRTARLVGPGDSHPPGRR